MMCVNKVTKKKRHFKSAEDLCESHETIYAVSIVNTTFDEQFDVDCFDKIAAGRLIRRLYVYGYDIGSEVMGGSQKYFVQFC